MTSTDNIPTPNGNDPGSFSSFRSTSDHDTPIDRYHCESTPPIHSAQRQIRLSSQQGVLSSACSSPSVVRNPSPPPIEDLNRADMVGDEMYSKSWFCRVLLKLIQFVAPEQMNDEIFATIREQGDNVLADAQNEKKKQELDERFESELCELWDISSSADVAHLLIEFKSLDLFNVVLLECKDKRCTEIVLGILSNLACCKRNLIEKNQSIAQTIVQHENLFQTVLSILTSDDYSDCPTLVQLYRLIYTLFVRQDTRQAMSEHIPLTYEPICFILQSCCNKDLLEQCSYLLRVLFDECHLFEHNEHHEVAFLFLTSLTTAINTVLENVHHASEITLENLFNCLQIYTTFEHCLDMLNEHCQIIMNLIELVLDRLVHDDIVQIRSVLMLSCISICNFYLDKHGLKIITKSLLEYLLIIGHTCYKDRQRRDHQKHSTRRQRSRTHSHSLHKRKEIDVESSTNENPQSKSDHGLNTIESTSNHDGNEQLNRSMSEDLSVTTYALIDELFLELFYRGLKEEYFPTGEKTSTSIFTQLSHDQRELFRKMIKHFCNLDQRLDDLLNLS